MLKIISMLSKTVQIST